jgi:hypothetical protein
MKLPYKKLGKIWIYLIIGSVALAILIRLYATHQEIKMIKERDMT